MTDLRRTILWMIFVTSLFFLWDSWQRHNGQPSMFLPNTAKTETITPNTGGTSNASTTAGSAAVPAAGAVATTAVSTPSSTTSALPASSTQATGERVTVTTDLVRATFDTQGAQLVKLELLKYPEHLEGKEKADAKTETFVPLFDTSAQRLYQAQTGLVGVEGLPNHRTLMTVEAGSRDMGSANELSLRFSSPDVAPAKLTQTYTFKRGSYAIDVSHEVKNLSAAPLKPKLYLQLLRDGNKIASNVPAAVEMFGVQTYTGPAVYSDTKKFQKVAFDEIEKNKTSFEPSANNGWVGMVQHYFATAWVYNKEGAREFQARKVDTNQYAVSMLLPVADKAEIAPQASASISTQLFAGPQEEHKLEALAPGLDLVKDYGWFAIFAKPLFWLLEKIHGIVGNWGWAIMGLTFLVKLAFYPLQAAAYKSMAKMKTVTPRMQEIRERYKSEPARMNQAMMELYKTEKVNPFGGCLPIVIQIPIFISLYWVLLSSVEMRGAPWLGWIHDLAVMDPFFILPAVMTATMFLQIKLNPTPPDPMQAKMMWIMPAVFSIFFFFFPAGLVLYWLTNNVLSIAQQWYINRQLGVK
jgi:YidC/Oxa1 family membrane protein insertase